ncbi:MAG: ABC transporter substrate-binding protein [Rhodobacteraceae bacterium]|nr:ABC transporter substrate-binding protein [Paracoccaceae bacterium]
MTPLNRRQLLRAGAAATALAASGMPALAAAPTRTPTRTPTRGGTLRLGLSGANTSDRWDSRTHADGFMIIASHGAVFDTLTEVAANGDLIGELAESWDASPDAEVWTFQLRRGVRFHNGKPFDADDVVASLNMHIAEGAKSAAQPIVKPITRIEKITDHEVRMTLESGNADFPYLLSDYHICMYPAGQIEEAIAKGIGTGLYRVERFDPGVRLALRRVESHYKDGRAGWFDTVEALAINDNSARMNALITRQVDVINRVDFKTEPLLRASPDIQIVEVTGNQHFTFPMLTNVAPFDDVNVRRALKHAVKRQEMVDKILQGHGAVANDIPIGPANRYFADDLPLNDYDPDKVKHYLGKAGLGSLALDLSASDAAFPGAVDAAQLYQASARAGGIHINVVQEPADGYWVNVASGKPWFISYWSGRVTEDWMFSTAYALGAPWNETHWNNARFQELLLLARAELDSDKRRSMYHEMQALISKEGGTVIPMYANYVDAHSGGVQHSGTIGNVFQLDSARLIERWWAA